MSEIKVRRCQCSTCFSTEEHPDKELHYQMNLLLSRLNEQQKRWYVALEAKKIGDGASKYNPIERCLFSPISINWAGKPLRSLDIMLGYIRDTSNKTGLIVKAFLLDQKYKVGQKVSDAEMRELNLIRRPICQNWNYMIKPR